VAELDGRAHLATFDQVGMRLENRLDFLGIGPLLAIEHAAARLIDHSLAETAIVGDLVANGVNRHRSKRVLAEQLGGFVECGSGARHHLVSNVDQRPVGRGLPRSDALALPRGHALYLVHASPRRTPAIAKTRDTSQLQRLGEAADQARDDAHHVPQQGVVGRMMNVGVDHRGVDPKLGTILQAKHDRGLNHHIIDGFDRLRRQPIEAAVEGVMFGYRIAIEIVTTQVVLDSSRKAQGFGEV
jgi:hypothetical protein